MGVEISEEDLFTVPRAQFRTRFGLALGAALHSALRNRHLDGRPRPLVFPETPEPAAQHQENRCGDDYSRTRAQGVNQIGEVQARSWITGTCAGLQQAS